MSEDAVEESATLDQKNFVHSDQLPQSTINNQDTSHRSIPQNNQHGDASQRHSNRRVGYAMSQAPRYRRTSGQSDFPSTAQHTSFQQHQQQQIAAMAAATAAANQPCFQFPYFVSQNGTVSNGGFDTQFMTYPTTGHLEAPFLFFDGKGYSIIPASMIPSNGSFNQMGYLFTPSVSSASCNNQFGAQRLLYMHANDNSQHKLVVDTEDKAIQVSISSETPIVSDNNCGNSVDSGDFWSVESNTNHNEDREIKLLTEKCNVENSKISHKVDSAFPVCNGGDYFQCENSYEKNDSQFDDWLDDNNVFITENGDQVEKLHENTLVLDLRKDSKENGILEINKDTRKDIPTNDNVKTILNNNRKSWASLFKLGGTSQNYIESHVKTLKDVTEHIPATSSTSNTTNGITWCQPKITLSTDRYTPKYNIVKDDFTKVGSLLRNFECRQSAPALTPRGLCNSANYCYVNCVIQALLSCPMFFNFIGSLPNIKYSLDDKDDESKKKDHLQAPTFMSYIKNVFENFQPMQRSNQSVKGGSFRRGQSDLKTGQPLNINEFHQLSDSLMSKIPGQQEDSHEFLCRLLQELHNECSVCIKLCSNTMKKENDFVDNIEKLQVEDIADDESEWQEYYGKRVHIHREIPSDITPVSEIFGGCLRTSLERGGSVTSSNLEPFHSLSIDAECPTILHALRALTSRVPVSGLHHPVTKKPIKGWQTMLIEKLPPCLILHVKCFSWNEGQKKLFPKMPILVDLMIPQEIMSRTSTSPRHYKLFAIIHHCGKTVHNGHYLCDVFHPGLPGWVRCDDQRVSVVHSREVLVPVSKSDNRSDLTPFILLYRQQ